MTREVRDAQKMKKLEAERDRLREENAELLAMLDADAMLLSQAHAKCERLREALQELVFLIDHDSFYDDGHEPTEMARARDALADSIDEV